MELILFLVELVVGVLDFVALVAEIVAWIKGRENRVERRIAKWAGTQVPARDKWNRRIIVLTIIVIVLTTGLVIRNLG